MADANLKVKIDAEIGGLQAGLKQAENAVKAGGANINTSVGKVQSSFTVLNNTKFTFGQNFTSASNQVVSQANKTGAALGTSLTKGSNQAGFALTNLGRVAQDAPFGFIGIQNNLNPLLESFQQLKQTTGSTGGALKALGQSLIGPAGLGLALSVVSAGILLYQQYQQKANKETKDAKKVTDDYADSLGQIEQAQLKGAQSAAKEQTELNVLFGIYQNANLPLSQRKKAYEELQNLYPDYFGNLKFEKEASEKTKTAYDKLSESILASGRARAAVDLITKNSQRQLENEQKIADINTQITKEQTTQKRLQGIVESQNLLAKQEANILTSKQKEILDQYLTAAAKEQKLIETKNNLITDSNILTEKNNLLNKAATAEAAKGGVITGKVGGDSVTTKGAKETKDALKELAIEFKKIENSVDITFGEGQKQKVKALATAIDTLIEQGQGAESPVIKGLKQQIIDINTVIPQVKTLGVTAATSFGVGFASAGPVLSKNLIPPLKQGLTDWQLYVNNDLLPQIEGNFKRFFDDILMNGKDSFDSLGKALLNTLFSIIASDAAKQVTNLFTSAEPGVAKKGAGGLFSVLGGLFKGGGKAAAGSAATAGAGTAATGAATAAGGSILLPILGGLAAGALIGGLFKKKKTEPAQAPSTTNANSSYISPSSGTDSGRVVFEISGTNLIGVLNRSGAKLSRFGG